MWALLQRLNTWRLEARARHEGLAELRGLSDATLKDLGVGRCEIDSIDTEAHGAAESTRRRIVARDAMRAHWHGQP